MNLPKSNMLDDVISFIAINIPMQYRHNNHIACYYCNNGNFQYRPTLPIGFLFKRKTTELHMYLRNCNSVKANQGSKKLTADLKRPNITIPYSVHQYCKTFEGALFILNHDICDRACKNQPRE